MDVAREVAAGFSAMEAATKVAIFAQPDGADSIAAYGIVKVRGAVNAARENGRNFVDVTVLLLPRRRSLYGLHFGRDRPPPSHGSGRQGSFAFASEARCEMV